MLTSILTTGQGRSIRHIFKNFYKIGKSTILPGILELSLYGIDLSSENLKQFHKGIAEI